MKPFCVVSFCVLVHWPALAEAGAEVIYVPTEEASIQAAIDGAMDGDEILVLPGTYFENIDFAGRNIRLASVEGPLHTTIDGSRPRDPAVRTTVTFGGGETTAAVLEGFTITGGGGTWTANLGGFFTGGGILCRLGSSPTIRGNLIRGNQANNAGGITLANSNAVVENNLLWANEATPRPENPTFLPTGGAITVTFGSPIIRNNTIVENVCESGGGGIGVLFADTIPLIANNIIVDNHGGGVEVFDGARALIVNSCIWRNPMPFAGEAQCADGCLVVDPLFVSPETGDFRLRPESPCRDRGLRVLDGAPTDLFGGPRVCGVLVDVGAFEVCEASFRRGDANDDGRADVTDPIGTLRYLFLGGDPPACLDAADANDDGDVDISDPVLTLQALFVGGAALPPPGLETCGPDPTPDDLGCDDSASCGVDE